MPGCGHRVLKAIVTKNAGFVVLIYLADTDNGVLPKGMLAYLPWNRGSNTGDGEIGREGLWGKWEDGWMLVGKAK